MVHSLYMKYECPSSKSTQNKFSPLQSEIIRKNKKILEVFSQNKRREMNNGLILQATRETVTQILTRND